MTKGHYNGTPRVAPHRSGTDYFEQPMRCPVTQAFPRHLRTGFLPYLARYLPTIMSVTADIGRPPPSNTCRLLPAEVGNNGWHTDRTRAGRTRTSDHPHSARGRVRPRGPPVGGVSPLARSSRAANRARASRTSLDAARRTPVAQSCGTTVRPEPETQAERRARWSRSRSSATAMLCRVRSMASAFTEIESIPHSTRCWAYSGCTDGA